MDLMELRLKHLIKNKYKNLKRDFMNPCNSNKHLWNMIKHVLKKRNLL